MKELKLGPDGVLPIIENFDIDNKPICIIGLPPHNDIYYLYKYVDIYQFKRIHIDNGNILYTGLFKYGTHKNYYETIRFAFLHVINGRDDYKIVQFNSFQEMEEFYNHNQIKDE